MGREQEISWRMKGFGNSHGKPLSQWRFQWVVGLIWSDFYLQITLWRKYKYQESLLGGHSRSRFRLHDGSIIREKHIFLRMHRRLDGGTWDHKGRMQILVLPQRAVQVVLICWTLSMDLPFQYLFQPPWNCNSDSQLFWRSKGLAISWSSLLPCDVPPHYTLLFINLHY